MWEVAVEREHSCPGRPQDTRLMNRLAPNQTNRRRQLFFALVWLGGWWTFTVSIGWKILGEFFASPISLEPLSSLASRLF